VIVLDTNVVSELMRPAPDPNVIAWVDRQAVSDLVITAITAAELKAGVELLSHGRRRAAIAEQIEALLDETFAGSVLPFDVECSRHYGDIVARRTRAGAPIAAFDAQIAAVCRQHKATLATRNRRDFAGIDLHLVDPWTAATGEPAPGAD